MSERITQPQVKNATCKEGSIIAGGDSTRARVIRLLLVSPRFTRVRFISLRSERRALLSEHLVQAMGKMRENYDPGLSIENSCLGVERQPAYASYPGRANFLIHFLTK